MEQEDFFGNPIIKPGNIVVMDNCRFHHGRNTGPILRNMLAVCGVQLVFKPPYHLQYNVCELCFHSLKCHLRKYTSFSVPEKLNFLPLVVLLLECSFVILNIHAVLFPTDFSGPHIQIRWQNILEV